MHSSSSATRPQVDFDLFGATMRQASDDAWRSVRDSKCSVAWTEHNGGHWVISSYDAMAAVFRDWKRMPATFTPSALTPSAA